MDRQGFTLLAFCFEGAKALAWKRKYIAVFDAMEAELRSRRAKTKP
jgi:phage regulator Rha-like protein